MTFRRVHGYCDMASWAGWLRPLVREHSLERCLSRSTSPGVTDGLSHMESCYDDGFFVNASKLVRGLRGFRSFIGEANGQILPSLGFIFPVVTYVFALVSGDHAMGISRSYGL